jgi:hypothetical protein
MNPDQRNRAARAIERVLLWANFYTFGLPYDIRNDRLDEVHSDLYEQVAAADRRSSDRTLARLVVDRAIRGAMADVNWRRAELRGAAPRYVSRVVRVVVAASIVAGLAASAVLFASSNAASSNASQATVQVGGLKYQLHSEALFVVNRSSAVAGEARWEIFDPNYTQALKADQEGVITEQNNLRLLLSQLASEQRQAAVSSATVNKQSVMAEWLTGLSAAAFLVLVIVLWFEPRWRSAPDSRPKS